MSFNQLQYLEIHCLNPKHIYQSKWSYNYKPLYCQKYLENFFLFIYVLTRSSIVHCYYIPFPHKLYSNLFLRNNCVTLQNHFNLNLSHCLTRLYKSLSITTTEAKELSLPRKSVKRDSFLTIVILRTFNSDSSKLRNFFTNIFCVIKASTILEYSLF